VARVVAGIGCSHAPSIAHAYDHRLTEDPPWKPLFTAFARARQWLFAQKPDALVVIYNDHVDQYFFDAWPTFTVGVADEYQIADEGWGPARDGQDLDGLELRHDGSQSRLHEHPYDRLRLGPGLLRA
jgi:gallate dioxygenase